MNRSQTAQFLSDEETPEDLASWTGATNSNLVYAQAVAVFAKRKTRSWDLMPPDVVKPLTSKTLGGLICIAQSLWMVGIDSVPIEGKIRAEGLGQSLSSTMIRGMGPVVEYNQEPGFRLKHTREMFKNLYVPSIAAAKVRHLPADSVGMRTELLCMIFGIIPGNPTSLLEISGS